MEDAPAVGVGDRLADVGESVEQVPERSGALPGVAALLGVGPVESGDRLLEADPPDESHRIERPALVVDPQAVDRDDPRMLEPAGHLGFQHEPGATVGIVGAFGLDLLQGHLALELRIECDRDLADAALGVRPDDPEPHALGSALADRPSEHGIDGPSFSVDLERAGVERVVIVRPLIRSRSVIRLVVLAVDRDRRQGRVGARIGGHRRVDRDSSSPTALELVANPAEVAQGIQATAQIAAVAPQQAIRNRLQELRIDRPSIPTRRPGAARSVEPSVRRLRPGGPRPGRRACAGRVIPGARPGLRKAARDRRDHPSRRQPSSGSLDCSFSI